MTYKKIFAIALTLVLALGSVLSVSALTPPYSNTFVSETEMLDALNSYSDAYPYYDNWYFDRKPDKGYHKEYRQVISVEFDISDLKAEDFTILESGYGYGIDTTVTFFGYENGPDGILRSTVYYGYNSDEVSAALENAKKTDGTSTFDEGTIDEFPYVFCKSAEDIIEPPSGDIYIAADKYLIHIFYCDPDILSRMSIRYTDTYIPVKVKDSSKWFEETMEDGYVVGDVNSDNVLNIKDATALQKYCAKLGTVDKLVANFNGDMKIDIKDATDIQKKLAGLPYRCRRVSYPVTYVYNGSAEPKLIEATTDYTGPYTPEEDVLITNCDGSHEFTLANVIYSEAEFEAFFGKTRARYNKEFFENNALVYLYSFYSSSSYKLIPKNVMFADGVLYANCISKGPGEGEEIEDMLSNNNLFFEVKKSDIAGLKGICINEHA